MSQSDFERAKKYSEILTDLVNVRNKIPNEGTGIKIDKMEDEIVERIAKILDIKTS